MKVVRGSIALLFLLLLTTLSFADEIEIPFPMYSDSFKIEAKEKGLDLYGNRDSQGFIKDEGSKTTIYTYHAMTMAQLELIRSFMWKHVRK